MWVWLGLDLIRTLIGLVTQRAPSSRGEERVSPELFSFTFVLQCSDLFRVVTRSWLQPVVMSSVFHTILTVDNILNKQLHSTAKEKLFGHISHNSKKG